MPLTFAIRNGLSASASRFSAWCSGGVAHFGFRLEDAADIGGAIAAIRRAGGKVLESGEFYPGEPYVFFEDPDGRQVEVWYELSTPVDPR